MRTPPDFSPRRLPAECAAQAWRTRSYAAVWDRRMSMSHLSNVTSAALTAGDVLKPSRPRPGLAAPPSPVLRATRRGDRPSRHSDRPSGVCGHAVQRSGRAGAHNRKALLRRWHSLCGWRAFAEPCGVPSRFEGGGLPVPSRAGPKRPGRKGGRAGRGCRPDRGLNRPAGTMWWFLPRRKRPRAGAMRGDCSTAP